MLLVQRGKADLMEAKDRNIGKQSAPSLKGRDKCFLAHPQTRGARPQLMHGKTKAERSHPPPKPASPPPIQAHQKWI